MTVSELIKKLQRVPPDTVVKKCVLEAELIGLGRTVNIDFIHHVIPEPESENNDSQ